MYFSQQPKYLLVGSAPMSAGWWVRYGAYFKREGWSIVAVNNAWQVVFPDAHEWYHASDYPEFGTLFPSPPQLACLRQRTVTSCQLRAYKDPKTCIAVLDTLYMLRARHQVRADQTFRSNATDAWARPSFGGDERAV